jgi:hypothetical protein
MGYPNVAYYNVRARQLGLPEVSPSTYNQTISYSGGLRQTEQAKRIAQQRGVATSVERDPTFGYFVPSGGSSSLGMPPAPPQLPQFNFEMPSLEIPDITLTQPQTVGRMDVLGVRSRKGGQRGTLRNQRTISSSQMSSLASAARRAGLNLPV